MASQEISVTIATVLLLSIRGSSGACDSLLAGCGSRARLLSACCARSCGCTSSLLVLWMERHTDVPCIVWCSVRLQQLLRDTLRQLAWMLGILRYCNIKCNRLHSK